MVFLGPVFAEFRRKFERVRKSPCLRLKVEAIIALLMIKRLITTWLLLMLLALPAASSIYQVVQLSEAKGCCAGQSSHCQSAMSVCQAPPNCPPQCLCAASEKPGSPGLPVNRPPLPSGPAPLVAALPFAAWLDAQQSNVSLHITTPSQSNNTYLHHACLRI